MYTFDHDLFLALNFDGGSFMDSLMLLASGRLTWAPLYALLLYVVYRRYGWQRTLLYVAVVVLAVGLADIFSGIFKHSGPLKHLYPSFEARPRPMHTPSLEGLVHFVKVGGQYGTISAHAATTTAIALISCYVVRRRWCYIVLPLWVVVVSYSRIYLGLHFPADIALGVCVGLAAGAVSIALYEAILRTKLFAKDKEQGL